MSAQGHVEVLKCRAPLQIWTGRLSEGGRHGPRDETYPEWARSQTAME